MKAPLSLSTMISCLTKKLNFLLEPTQSLIYDLLLFVDRLYPVLLFSVANAAFKEQLSPLLPPHSIEF